jgi:hypothetical protein
MTMPRHDSPCPGVTLCHRPHCCMQATRVKFVFDDEALEVVIAGKEEKETENAFVGGRNRWRCVQLE